MTVTPDQLERVKDVLDEALKLDLVERRSFVAAACAAEEAVRAEVESLLEQDALATTFLEQPLFSLCSGLARGAADELPPGLRIGPYQVVRELGKGGMGTVVLAVREDDFEKRVALKLIRPGLFSAELARRFLDERQILAHLDHPNVARILDGGTTGDGRPYFAMEYVEGLPIDEYCVRHALSVRRRLVLFRQVCAAIQLAHQNLVVHRDLKPANVLVTAQGIPKLLDFGIAKRLTPEAGDELTRLDQRPMTILYASPEQIAGSPVTTASDVYSLGVLLYQLLTGRSPYATAGDSELEVARAVREEEPRRPSTAARDIASPRDPRHWRRLAGDLDAIVMRALRKEPRHRYGSVEQLSEDVRRHLEGLPVAARKGSWSYRAGKLVRRHKLGLGATAALLLLGLGFTLTSTLLWRKAVRERARSVEVLEFLKGLFRTSDPDAARGEELTAREILERGLGAVDAIEDPLVKAEILGTVGEVLVNLGHYDEARPPRERALEILRQVYREDHPELAKAINNLAGVLYRQGDGQAEALYREALAMRRRLGQEGADLTKAMSNLATILTNRGAFEEGEELYRRSLEIRRGAYGPEDEDVATSLRSLGNLLYLRGAFAEAEPLMLEALDLRRRLLGPRHTKVGAVLASLGRLRHAQRRYAQAEEDLAEALDVQRTRLGEDHPDTASTQRDLAALYVDLGELARAEALLAPALAALRELGESSWKVAEAQSVLGALRTRQGRYEEAEHHLLASYRTLRAVRGEQAVFTRNVRRRLAELYLAWGKPEKAAEVEAGAI